MRRIFRRGLDGTCRRMVQNTFRAYAIRTTTILEYESAKTMKEFVEKGQMKFIRLPDEDMARARATMYEITKEYAETKGELTKETYQKLDEFYRIYYPYREVSAWWGKGLTANEAAGFEVKSYLED